MRVWRSRWKQREQVSRLGRARTDAYDGVSDLLSRLYRAARRLKRTGVPSLGGAGVQFVCRLCTCIRQPCTAQQGIERGNKEG